MTVHRSARDTTCILTIDRPERRNAVDPATAAALKRAIIDAERDETVRAIVLTGAGGQFCAGADLNAVAAGDWTYDPEAQDGPLGPTRMALSKPAIAAVEGYAVAGGLELALMCDLRVASETAVFGVYCRRWGVPLVDGGTVRLPRLIGQGRALDMILTGRAVGAREALDWGLANLVVEEGGALEAALEIARAIAQFPQTCMLNDRDNAIAQWSLPLDEALRREARLGAASLTAGAAAGAARFAAGAGRGGARDEAD